MQKKPFIAYVTKALLFYRDKELIQNLPSFNPQSQKLGNRFDSWQKLVWRAMETDTQVARGEGEK